jgi:glutathione synthase
MRMLFVADPFVNLNPCHDSTVAMIEEAQLRGHEVFGCTIPDLAIGLNGPYADVTPLVVKPANLVGTAWHAEPDWLTIGPSERMPLREFATISMRTDPPVDEAYLRATWLLDYVDPRRTVVVNRPAGLRNANEKLYALNFPNDIPRCVVSSRRLDLLAFTETVGTAVIKPTGGMAGRGVLLLRDGDPNLASIIDSVTGRGAHQVMAQEYLPAVTNGDRRVILVDGVAVGSIVRTATGGDFRCNMATGGSVKADGIDDVAELVARIGPRLRTDGLWFVGLDVIGGKVTEINVTSPTGIREIHALCGVDVAAAYIECNERLAKDLR